MRVACTAALTACSGRAGAPHRAQRAARRHAPGRCVTRAVMMPVMLALALQVPPLGLSSSDSEARLSHSAGANGSGAAGGSSQKTGKRRACTQAAGPLRSKRHAEKACAHAHRGASVGGQRLWQQQQRVERADHHRAQRRQARGQRLQRGAGGGAHENRDAASEGRRHAADSCHQQRAARLMRHHQQQRAARHEGRASAGLGMRGARRRRRLSRRCPPEAGHAH